jgi:outer membrane protein OmpA-like peptidoglycan-associated protein
VTAALAAPAAQPPPPAARVYAFTTRIPVAWDSAQLAPAAHRLLDTLAAVLQEALMADKVIRIEGHTDSAGSDAYNQRLSYRRAVAVQQYLADAHGLPRAHLPVVGKGKAELYDPAHPFAPSNRRVEFVNFTDSAARP